MTRWKEYKLGEFIKVKHGFAFKGDYIVPDETDKILVTPGNFNIGGGFKSDKFKYYNSEDFPQDYILKSGDIVVTMTDLSKDSDTLGYSAIIPFSKNKKYLHNQRIGLVQFISDKVCPNFVYWLLRTKEYQSYIVGSASGTSIMHTSPSRIENYSCLFPPLNEQRRIASILSSLDDKIDLLHRENATLEQMAETLFRQWFVVEAKDEWEEGTIADLAEFNPTRKLVKGSIAPFLEMSNLSTSTYAPTYWYDRAYNSGTKFENGDTLLARITPCLENGKTAYVDFLRDNQVGWGSTEFIVMHSKLGLHPFFTYVIAKYQDFRDFAESCMSGSSGRQRVDVDNLRKYPMAIPDKVTVELFNDRIENMVSKMHNNNKQIQTLIQTRDGLLPRLMGGEVKL